MITRAGEADELDNDASVADHLPNLGERLAQPIEI
jgi:hypothetical protein